MNLITVVQIIEVMRWQGKHTDVMMAAVVPMQRLNAPLWLTLVNETLMYKAVVGHQINEMKDYGLEEAFL